MYVTKNIVHSFKQGVVEYSNSREEGGMSNLQVVEVKKTNAQPLFNPTRM